MAIRALSRMYRAQDGLFAFRIRRGHGAAADETVVSRGDSTILEGISRRYTAIVLIGLADQEASAAESVFNNKSIYDICDQLLFEVESWNNLGDIALTLWAANRLGVKQAKKALCRLRELDPVHGLHPTVEVAWALTALSVEPEGPCGDPGLAMRIARRLMANFHSQSRLFPHWPDGLSPSRLRAHVTCFADWVYPVQALSHFHLWTRDSEAADIARASARQMCGLLGPQGQWWWHYDVRTGRVVEGYPVYAVHQNSMAPMALFALQDACGVDSSQAIRMGLQWLIHSPEIGGSLMDRGSDLIWRKVARHEPGKLVRGLQGLASRIHPSVRLPGMDGLFPATWIDFESRPYHMGWILHAWGKGREFQLTPSSSENQFQSST